MTKQDAPGVTPKARARKRFSVTGLLGELLVTAGALVLLFIAWQVVWNGGVVSGQQSDAAHSLAQEWAGQSGWTPGNTIPEETPDTDFGDPLVAEAPRHGGNIAVMYVPRFGDNWSRIIRQGTTTDIINSTTAGVGHYENTQMPGEVGNFAVAAHDTSWGDSFLHVSKLQLDDPIYLQTPDGWYTYRFRNFEYVQPDAVSVLLPVPRIADAVPTERFMTLTTCNPPYNAKERLIAYTVLSDWRPASAGPPAALAKLLNAKAG